MPKGIKGQFIQVSAPETEPDRSGREDAEDKFKEYRDVLEGLLEKPAGAQLQAKAVRKGDDKGRHTTVAREMVPIPGGGVIIDTPGMRELGMLGAQEGIGETFADINALAQGCRYVDCRHASEPGCEVRAAIERHELSEEHLRNFLKLQKEADFNDLSYIDRRKKDRAFGRFLHTYKKRKDGRDHD